MSKYVIRGGEAGYQRLLLLARVRRPDTLALFRRAGLSPGMRCIDLGCGGGEVSFEIARLVAPGGSVIGADIDEVKLDLARQAAAERRLDNVAFRTLDIYDWDEPRAYDAVYARFLLQHLSNPTDVLGRMWDGVRPGGVLIVEDADFDGWCCDPPDDSFEFFLRAYGSVLTRRGGHPATGRTLYRHFLDVGIPTPEVAVVQPVYLNDEGKTLAWTTLNLSADAIVADGIASRAEVSAALTGLRAFTERPGTLISGPRVFQLWARR